MIGKVTERQARTLEPMYSVVYLDCTVMKISVNQQMMPRIKISRKPTSLGATAKDNLNTFYSYRRAIRKTIYITNALDSLNRVVRTATRQQKGFSHSEICIESGVSSENG